MWTRLARHDTLGPLHVLRLLGALGAGAGHAVEAVVEVSLPPKALVPVLEDAVGEVNGLLEQPGGQTPALGGPVFLHPCPVSLHPRPIFLHPWSVFLHPCPMSLHPCPVSLHPWSMLLQSWAEKGAAVDVLLC